MSDKWEKPTDVSDVLMAFPAGISHLMPPREEIPKHFPDKQKWDRLFSECFYSGVTDLELTARAGIDEKKAWRHLRTIMGSFEPKHEHKEEAWAYLASRWFEDAKWKRAPQKQRA